MFYPKPNWKCDALPDDVHAISAIYAWHVLHGRASLKKFPTIDEMRQRMKGVAIAVYRGLSHCIAASLWVIAMPHLIAHVTPIDIL
jgi:hypothetical protein